MCVCVLSPGQTCVLRRRWSLWPRCSRVSRPSHGWLKPGNKDARDNPGAWATRGGGTDIHTPKHWFMRTETSCLINQRTTLAISVPYSMHMMCMQVFHMHAYSDDPQCIVLNKMRLFIYSAMNEPLSVFDFAAKSDFFEYKTWIKMWKTKQKHFCHELNMQMQSVWNVYCYTLFHALLKIVCVLKHMFCSNPFPLVRYAIVLGMLPYAWLTVL